MVRSLFLFCAAALAAQAGTMQITVNLTGTATNSFDPGIVGDAFTFSAVCDFSHNDPLSSNIPFAGGLYPAGLLFASDGVPAAVTSTVTVGPDTGMFNVGAATAGDGLLYADNGFLTSSGGDSVVFMYSLSGLSGMVMDLGDGSAMAQLLEPVPLQNVNSAGSSLDFETGLFSVPTFLGTIATASVTITETPEPATFMMLLGGLGLSGGLSGRRR